MTHIWFTLIPHWTEQGQEHSRCSVNIWLWSERRRDSGVSGSFCMNIFSFHFILFLFVFKLSFPCTHFSLTMVAAFPGCNVPFMEIVWQGRDQRHLFPMLKGPIGIWLRLVQLESPLDNDGTHVMELLCGLNELIYLIFSPGLCALWQYCCY